MKTFWNFFQGLYEGIAKLLAKFGADALLNFLCHDQCDNHMLHIFIPSFVKNSGSELERWNLMRIHSNFQHQSVTNSFALRALASLL